MNELQQKFDKLIEDQRELQRQFQETGKKLFKEVTKEFFEKNTGITAIIWTQYTPYFNDGDTCEFNVNDATFTNAPDPENVSWGEYEGEEENVFATDCISYVMESDRDYYQADKKLILSVIESGKTIDIPSCQLMSKVICSSEMQSIMLALFGDHVKVIATSDGFEVEEYEHD